MQADWLKSGHMLWYFHGNMHKDVAKDIAGRSIDILGLSKIAKDQLSDLRQVDLSSAPNHFHRLDFNVEDPDNENSAMLQYFQLGLNDDNDRRELMNRVVLQYLDEPCFDQLRTKEQLGYVVFSRPRSQRDVIGAWVLVQSPGKDCLYVRDRIQVWLAKMRKKVQALTEEDFKVPVGAVRINLQEKDKNMSEEAARMLGELTSHRYNFKRQEENLVTLDTLTLDEFKAHFESLFFQPGNGNRLDMQYHSKKHLDNPTPAGEAPATEESKTDGEASEPEPEIDNSTERKHSSVSHFKKRMGLFTDTFQNNYIHFNGKL